MEEYFKICSCCHKKWTTQDKFISDTEIVIIGYKANFDKLTHGLFFFNHLHEDCYSTITIEAQNFLNLYNGPYYQEQKTGTVDCKGYCKNEKNWINVTHFVNVHMFEK
jgi:hypothetical protein